MIYFIENGVMSVTVVSSQTRKYVAFFMTKWIKIAICRAWTIWYDRYGSYNMKHINNIDHVSMIYLGLASKTQRIAVRYLYFWNFISNQIRHKKQKCPIVFLCIASYNFWKRIQRLVLQQLLYHFHIDTISSMRFPCIFHIVQLKSSYQIWLNWGPFAIEPTGWFL